MRLPVALHGVAISSQVDNDGSLAMPLLQSNPILIADLNNSQLDPHGRGLLSLTLHRDFEEGFILSVCAQKFPSSFAQACILPHSFKVGTSEGLAVI